MDVGDRRRRRRIAEGAPGLGLEPPDLGDHVAQVLVVDAADAAQQRKVPPGERRQVLDERLHRRIEAVALLELKGQALGERARKHAGRLEGLHAQEHALDALDVGAEPFGDFGQSSRRNIRPRPARRSAPRRSCVRPDREAGSRPDARDGREATRSRRHKPRGLGPRRRHGRRRRPSRPCALKAVGRGGLERRRGAVRIEGVVDLGAEIGGKAARVRLQRLARPIARFGAALRQSRRLGGSACSRLGSSRSSARSSSGLLANSFSMNWVSSRFGICSSLIACRSCGVRTIA